MAERLDRLLGRLELIQVVSGDGTALDAAVEDWAVLRGHTIRRIPADPGRFGVHAERVANYTRVWFATHLVVWGKARSAATAHLVAIAREQGLGIRQVRVM